MSAFAIWYTEKQKKNQPNTALPVESATCLRKYFRILVAGIAFVVNVTTNDIVASWCRFCRSSVQPSCSR